MLTLSQISEITSLYKSRVLLFNSIFLAAFKSLSSSLENVISLTKFVFVKLLALSQILKSSFYFVSSSCFLIYTRLCLFFYDYLLFYEEESFPECLSVRLRSRDIAAF